jgi:hypothetical protein
MSSYSIEKGDKHVIVHCDVANLTKEVVQTIFNEYVSNYDDWNVVLNLSKTESFNEGAIVSCEQWFQHVKNGEHSFIVTGLNDNLGHFLPNIEQVPSISEAQDLIFMEEVERDLGVHLDFDEEE